MEWRERKRERGEGGRVNWEAGRRESAKACRVLVPDVKRRRRERGMIMAEGEGKGRKEGSGEDRRGEEVKEKKRWKMC